MYIHVIIIQTPLLGGTSGYLLLWSVKASMLFCGMHMAFGLIREREQTTPTFCGSSAGLDSCKPRPALPYPFIYHYLGRSRDIPSPSGSPQSRSPLHAPPAQVLSSLDVLTLISLHYQSIRSYVHTYIYIRESKIYTMEMDT